MRAWCVGRLGERSDVGGGNNLDVDLGRFVGIAPEAIGVQGQGIGNVNTYTMNDLQKAKEQLDNLSAVVKPENLEKVKSLLGKL